MDGLDGLENMCRVVNPAEFPPEGPLRPKGMDREGTDSQVSQVPSSLKGRADGSLCVLCPVCPHPCPGYADGRCLRRRMPS